MLIECGYLNDNDNYLYMDKTNITVKGLIAMEVNECNELIFTEIIYNGLLDKLDLTDIIGIIACFVSEREKDGEKGKNKMQMDAKHLVALEDKLFHRQNEMMHYRHVITSKHTDDFRKEVGLHRLSSAKYEYNIIQKQLTKTINVAKYCQQKGFDNEVI